MPIFPRRQLLGFGCALVALMPAFADAQDYPTREIHSIVNFPPGTGMDIMIRYYSIKLSELAGKPVIVENKPGATGNIATEYVTRSKPDGYTIMITPASSTLAAAAALFKKLPFDPVKDLQPVLLMTKLGFVFVVDGNYPARTMSELTAVLKSKPGHGAYASAANTGTVAAEMYKVRAGLDTNQVLYKGTVRHVQRPVWRPDRFRLIRSQRDRGADTDRQGTSTSRHVDDACGFVARRTDHAGSRVSRLRL